MESFLNRYRNITVLLLVILAQLVLLSLQVKNDQDVRFIRVWTVTAVSPLAKVVDALRGSTIGVVRNYIRLHDTDAENRRLQSEVDRLRLDNIFLKNEINTADRAKALQVFQARVPSRTLAARVISRGLGAGAMVFVDRGTLSGVMRGMGVITPDGIFGKVMAAYPAVSEVLLVTDPEFAAGVVSARSQARGILKGQGSTLCKVDDVPFEDKVEPGDWFYTSGTDRIFPSGFPAGVVKSVRPGQPSKEISLDPSGLWRGLEDVLIVLETVHQEIPNAPPSGQPVYIAPPPTAAAPAAPSSPNTTSPAPGGTDLDRLHGIYKSAGEAQGHTFGEGIPGSRPPDFTKLPGAGTGPQTSQPAPNPLRPPVQASPPAAKETNPASKGTSPPSKGTGPEASKSLGPEGAPARRANQAGGGGR